jgi:hypothetical protein
MSQHEQHSYIASPATTCSPKAILVTKLDASTSQTHFTMAEQKAKTLRQQHLSSLGVQYPLWTFSADDPRWPRRLDSLLPNSHPAKITRWVASFSEYAMHLSPLQDRNLSSENSSKPTTTTRSQTASLALSALTQLRYDDTYDPDSLCVIFSNDQGKERTKPLSAWVFDDSHKKKHNDYIDPATVLRIERKWDSVPLWDPKQNLNRLSDFGPAECIFGVATLVADDEELVFASGISKSDRGEGIRKAEFECLDDGSAGAFVQGVVCPPRWVEQGDQGLVLRRGPKDKRNRQVLAGTVLQNAPWEEVMEYGKGMRLKPLW